MTIDQSWVNRIDIAWVTEKRRHLGFRDVRGAVRLQRGNQRLVAIDHRRRISVMMYASTYNRHSNSSFHGVSVSGLTAPTSHRVNSTSILSCSSVPNADAIGARLRLLRVAPECDPRHLQVMPDEKVDRLRCLIVKTQPSPHRRGHLCADDGVIALARLPTP
jgi:hypothetical protein